MMTFFKLIGGVKGLVIAAIIAAAIGWIVVQKQNLSEAIKAKDNAVSAQKFTQLQLDKAIDTAKENQLTIDKLKEEKKLVEVALQDLEKAKTVNKQTVAKTNKKIDEQAALPANQTPISPVLKSVITDVQNERTLRRNTITE